MQAIAQRLTSLAARIDPPSSVVPIKHYVGLPYVERDGSGIWVGDVQAGSSRMVQPYAQNPTIYAAVSQISRNFSSVPFEFFRGDTDEALPVTDAFVRGFWAAVRVGEMTPKQFTAKYAQDMELSGDWFLTMQGSARVSKRGSQFPVGFYRRPRNRMTPNVDMRTGFWDGSWKYRTFTGTDLVFDAEQVVHAFYPNPYSDRMGLAPIQAALMEADSDYAAMMWNRYFFENDTSSGIVFKRDKDAFSDPVNDDRFIEWWNERRAGTARSHNAVMPPPGVDVTELGATQRDMAFTELRKLSREQILSVLSVPPPVAGIFDDATLANILQALRFFWYHKLFPMMDDFEATIQSDILDRFNTGVRCAFKREMVQALIDDLSAKLEAAVKLWGMGVPFEQINDRLDLGFDTSLFDGANIGYLPFSVQAIGAEAPPEPTAPAGGQAPPKGQPPPEGNSGPVAVKHGDVARRRRWLGYMQMTDRAERDMLNAWRGFIDWAGEHAISDLKSTQQAIYLNLIKHEGKTILPDDDEVMNEAERRMRAAHAGAYRAGRTAAEADLGIDLDFKLLDRKVLKANQERRMYIKAAALGERDSIRAKIDKGIKDGASIDKIEESIRQHMSEARQGMARTVARTETMSAFSRARMDSFGEAGVTKQEWMSAHDDLVRESHQIDGEQVMIGSAFSNGLFFPMDPNGPAEEVINCRCVALPVVA